MSQWGSRKARLVLAALLQIGWQIKRQSGGSHRVLARPVRIGFPRLLAKIAAKPEVSNVLIRFYDYEDALDFDDAWINTGLTAARSTI